MKHFRLGCLEFKHLPDGIFWRTDNSEYFFLRCFSRNMKEKMKSCFQNLRNTSCWNVKSWSVITNSFPGCISQESESGGRRLAGTRLVWHLYNFHRSAAAHHGEMRNFPNHWDLTADCWILLLHCLLRHNVEIQKQSNELLELKGKARIPYLCP